MRVRVLFQIGTGGGGSTWRKRKNSAYLLGKRNKTEKSAGRRSKGKQKKFHARGALLEGGKRYR